MATMAVRENVWRWIRQGALEQLVSWERAVERAGYRQREEIRSQALKRKLGGLTPSPTPPTMMFSQNCSLLPSQFKQFKRCSMEIS